MGVVDVEDLVPYLASKGLQVKRAHGFEVVVACWECDDGKSPKLYLNTDSWLYECKRCGMRGNRKTLLRHFGDEDNVSYTPGNDPHVKQMILQEAAELAHEMLLGNDDKLVYLFGRGLSPETITEHKLGYIPKNFNLAKSLPCFQRELAKPADLLAAGVLTAGGRSFYDECITIPYFQNGHVVQLREKSLDGKYRTTTGGVPRLFNADSLRGASEVVLTEGEFDAMSLRQALGESTDARLRAIAVVGLPGVTTWPDNFESLFDQVKTVYVGFDPDQAGRQAAIKVKTAVGTKVRVVELPSELPKCDWNEFFRPRSDMHPHGGHTWRDAKVLLQEADLHGKRLFNVSEAGLKWSRRRDDSPGVKTGYVTLDSVIRPGIKPGQVMIPLAKTGMGKSVFLSNLVHNTRSRRCLFLSLEMTAAEIYEHLHRIHHFHRPDASVDDMQDAYARLRIVDENRLAKSDLVNLVHEFTDDVGAQPELLVIDYLGYYARGFRGSSAYERLSDAVMEIKAVAKEFEMAVITPHQVNRGAEEGKPLEADDARDSGVIEETADFMLGMFRPGLMKRDDGSVQEDLSGAFNVQLLKSRHGGKGRLFNLRFSSMSLAIVEATDRKNAIRVEQENAAYRRGVHYEDFRSSGAQLRVV